MDKDKKIQELNNEINALKEQLKSYIPRRRVRRVYKQLKHILEQDIVGENIGYINYLKALITRYRSKESDTPIIVDEPTIVAIEHLLGFYDTNDKGWS